MSMNDLPPPPPQSPYGTPLPARAVDGVPVATRAAAAAKLKAPAIILIVCACLGAVMSVVSLIMSLVVTPERMEEFLRQLMPSAGPNAFAGATGSQAVNIVSALLFMGLNGFIIFGAVQAMRVRAYPIAFAAAIAAMVNLGNCCCVLSLPFGIWLLVVLLNAEVKKAFDSAS